MNNELITNLAVQTVGMQIKGSNFRRCDHFPGLVLVLGAGLSLTLSGALLTTVLYLAFYGLRRMINLAPNVVSIPLVLLGISPFILTSCTLPPKAMPASNISDLARPAPVETNIADSTNIADVVKHNQRPQGSGARLSNNSGQTIDEGDLNKDNLQDAGPINAGTRIESSSSANASKTTLYKTQAPPHIAAEIKGKRPYYTPHRSSNFYYTRDLRYDGHDLDRTFSNTTQCKDTQTHYTERRLYRSSDRRGSYYYDKKKVNKRRNPLDFNYDRAPKFDYNGTPKFNYNRAPGFNYTR